MTTPKTKTVPTVAMLTELAQTLFRNGYEFKALSPKISLKNGFLTVEWDAEPATGMAKFSQKTVTVSMTLHRHEWRSDEFKSLNPWSLWNLDYAEGMEVKLEVNYDHWEMGCNGVSRHYFYENGKLVTKDLA